MNREEQKLFDSILEILLLDIDELKNNTDSMQYVEEKIRDIELWVKQLIRLREKEQMNIEQQEKINDERLFTAEQEKYILKLIDDHLNEETQKAFDRLPDDIKNNYISSKLSLDNNIGESKRFKHWKRR